MTAALPALEINPVAQLADKGILRRVARRFHKQYHFVGHHGNTVTVPTFEIQSRSKIVFDPDVPAEVSQRVLMGLFEDLVRQEDKSFLHVVDTCGDHAAAGATEGLAPLLIQEPKRVLDEMTFPMIERGFFPRHLFFNPLDYAKLFIFPRQDGYVENGHTFETKRSILETGVMGYFESYKLYGLTGDSKPAVVYMTRTVPQGFAYVFGARSDEQIGANPNLLDLLMVEHESATVTLSSSDRFGSIEVREEIGMSMSGNFAQKIILPTLERSA